MMLWTAPPPASRCATNGILETAKEEVQRNLYTCAHGKTLKTTGRVHDDKTLLYRSQKVERGLCHSSTGAVQRPLIARSHGMSMKMPEA
jgi:hypothetical protein